jgi:hypothetical protein
LHAWLAALARFLFETISFDFAVIGFEALQPHLSGETLRLKSVPAARSVDYLLRIDRDLEWFPASATINSLYSMEAADSTTTLRCTCCETGFTSVCGYIRTKNEGCPFGMYYALIHTASHDPVVRISVSIGGWWKHDTFENRRALCVDINPVMPDTGVCRFKIPPTLHSATSNLSANG